MSDNKLQGDTLLLYQDLLDGRWIREYCVSPACSCINYKKSHCDNATCRFYRSDTITITQKNRMGGKA